MIMSPRFRIIVKDIIPIRYQPHKYLILASGTNAEKRKRLYVHIKVRVSLINSRLF